MIEHQDYLIETGYFDYRDNEAHKVMVLQEQAVQLINEDVPAVVNARPSVDSAGVIGSRSSVCDVNYPNKQCSYIALESTDCAFIGPSKEPYNFSCITDYLHLANLIRHT